MVVCFRFIVYKRPAQNAYQNLRDDIYGIVKQIYMIYDNVTYLYMIYFYSRLILDDLLTFCGHSTKIFRRPE